MALPSIDSSPYLSDLLDRFGPQHDLDALIAAARVADTSESLLDLKDRFSLAFASAHSAAQSEDFAQLGRWQSTFADATVSAALRLAWAQTVTHRRLRNMPERPTGLFVLGLGKLGGFDLNFSSDIDLIAFYDPHIFPVPEHIGQAYIASDVMKVLTGILMPRGEPRFVWRVDWRLRPEASGTGLALSTSKAEQFYFFRALPWHRLALMKARVIAGDIECGTEFLEALTPFIWRRNLDFSAIDELAELKTRINQEHPGLKTERAATQPITDVASGFNLKLGRGGIREIEFIANAQQLIWGGKDAHLRTTNTQAALSRLAETGHMKTETAERLSGHYETLRRLENTLQMIGNEQTHILPNDPAQQAAILALTQRSDWAALGQTLNALRLDVHAQFQSLFGTESPEQTLATVQPDPTLSESSKTVLATWRNGFSNHGVRASRRGSLSALGQALATRLSSEAAPDAAIARVDRFLQTLSRSEQYFDLLRRHPGLLDALVEPLIHSPHMSDLLVQSPHIIDVFLAPDSRINAPNGELSDRAAFVLAQSGVESRLETLRRFVNEELYQLYHLFLRTEYALDRLQQELTRLAEVTLETAMVIVADDLELPHLDMAVLGLGKMGTRAMAPRSDLDLVFLFPDEHDPELSAKIVRRLRTAVSAPMREGVAYDLDMRLRPSGRSGPPAVKLSAFREHHMTRAHSWEHIALSRSRVVAGQDKLARAVMAVKSDILSRPRNRTAFLHDARTMWARIEGERITNIAPDHFATKLRRGGLMQSGYLLDCFAVLGEGPSPELEKANRFWQSIQVWERLLGLKGRNITDVPETYRTAVGAEQVLETTKASAATVTAEFNRLFDGVSLAKDLVTTSVLWTD